MRWYDAGMLAECQPELTVQQIADRLGIEKRTAERGLKYFKGARGNEEAEDSDN